MRTYRTMVVSPYSVRRSLRRAGLEYFCAADFE